MRCTRFWLFVLFLMLLSSTVILAQPYPGPIIDAHGHLGASFNWEILVEAMDRNHVTQRTVGYGTGWPRMEECTALSERDGVLFPDMKALYEEFPDRFMLGMDVAHAPGSNLRNYSRRVNRFRDLLGQLKPETAKKFVETNAIRVFKLGSAITC